MEIRVRATGAVVFENEFRAYAQTQGAVFGAPLTPEFIDQYGGDVVLEGPQAQPTRYQTAYRDGVEQLGGNWYTKYSVADMDDDAKAATDAAQAKAVREQRNTKLKDSDWTQVADAPVDKAAWATHRQALRDITKQAGFPWDITWPDAP
jgi:hypothetical protein